MKGNYPHWGSALSTSVTELLLLPKFNNNSPSVTQDTEIFHVIMSYHYYHLMRSTHGTLSMMFTCCPNLMFLAYVDFQTSQIATLSSSKLILI